MKPAHDHNAPTRFPFLQGVLPITAARVPSEIIAGITLAAIAVPEVMGYTKISGTPVITGLYTMLIPTALFALFGSSRHLVVGADSATAAILAAGLVGIAAIGSEQYLALAGVLALMAAVFLILARVLRLGFLADFLSRTVLIGFLTGVGIQVALGQIARHVGLEGWRPRHAGEALAQPATSRRGQSLRVDDRACRAGGHRRPREDFEENSGGLDRGDRRAGRKLGVRFRQAGACGRNRSEWSATLGSAQGGLELASHNDIDSDGVCDVRGHPGPERGNRQRLCHALRGEFQREHRHGRPGSGQYRGRAVRHLRRQRQPNEDANRGQLPAVAANCRSW